VTQIFSQVIKQNVSTGAATTSATTVTAASTPTPISLTLALATGFAQGNRVVIDVDSLEELATVRSITGSAISVILTKAHSGTYPVAVECGETIVRRLLARIRETKAKLASQFGSGALKKVDEVEFYQVAGNLSAYGVLSQNLMDWRRQLGFALGFRTMPWELYAGGSQQMSVY
jgi:hypothetical protein